MGEVRTLVKLKNIKGIEEAVTVDAMVDTGATLLVLPEAIFQQLNLDEVSKGEVEFGNGEKQEVKIAGYIEVEILGRKSVFDCAVVGNEVLIGQIILERLDLLIDPRRQQLIPRKTEILSFKIK
ncbi:MAG: clan AA aspartic protease [Desulfobacterales bacterium]|nr:clan AA aspartic protease [Desulfobacterales bacterium]